MPCIRSSCSCANSERSVYGRMLDSLLKCKCNVQPNARGHSSVNRTLSSQVESYIHSYSIRGQNAGHQNTSKKLAHSSTDNTINIKRSHIHISLIFTNKKDTSRHSPWDVCSAQLNSIIIHQIEVCLIRCSDAWLHIFWCLFIVCRNSTWECAEIACDYEQAVVFCFHFIP